MKQIPFLSLLLLTFTLNQHSALAEVVSTRVTGDAYHASEVKVDVDTTGGDGAADTSIVQLTTAGEDGWMEYTPPHDPGPADLIAIDDDDPVGPSGFKQEAQGSVAFDWMAAYIDSH
ncbi:MAG: hypothetical protein AB2728_16365 [Candidatus Thiodiazotropha sp.]|nr:hypothetical protein [Candidatus Thiodiazotropha sp. (ex Lucina pensylvanica)]